MKKGQVSNLEAGDLSKREAAESLALVVDLDGTLTPADTLFESVLSWIKRNPSDALRLPFWLLRGRAALKESVSTRSVIQVENLPFRTALIQYLRYLSEKRGAGLSSQPQRTTA